MSNRLDNTKVVTFKEAYKSKSGKVIYAAGSTHAIHKDLAAKLAKKSKGIDVKDFDQKGEIAKAKKAFEDSKKAD